jgi:hypothetical protein
VDGVAGAEESEVVQQPQAGSEPEGDIVLPPSVPRAGGNSKLPETLEVKVEMEVGRIHLDESTLRNSRILPYLRMVVGLIEGIQLRYDELTEILLDALRQHSFAYRTKSRYVLGFLHQHPP